mmetsp:Transcript_32427/g.43133  ORF Transcript_32427/g.43133 Transcript_32427/m.43133 type:complete len:83 (-) Transcript_32427:787-1035(-)
MVVPAFVGVISSLATVFSLAAVELAKGEDLPLEIVGELGGDTCVLGMVVVGRDKALSSPIDPELNILRRVWVTSPLKQPTAP